MAGAILNRAEAQVTRIACLYALLDGCQEIRIVHLQAALALWEYADASVCYIFDSRTGDPVADSILAALHQKEEGLTRTEINDLLKGNKSKDQIDDALQLLATKGLARFEKQPTGGRSREVWRVETSQGNTE